MGREKEKKFNENVDHTIPKDVDIQTEQEALRAIDIAIWNKQFNIAEDIQRDLDAFLLTMKDK